MGRVIDTPGIEDERCIFRGGANQAYFLKDECRGGVSFITEKTVIVKPFESSRFKEDLIPEEHLILFQQFLCLAQRPHIQVFFQVIQPGGQVTMPAVIFMKVQNAVKKPVVIRVCIYLL